MRISVQTSIDADLNKVWQSYTSPSAIMMWNAASDDWHTTRASVDLRVGGEFSSRMEAKDGSMGFDFSGTYTEVVENRKLSYSFGERNAEVTFNESDDGIIVNVTFDAETVYPIEQQQQGWQAILNNFKKYVETQTP